MWFVKAAQELLGFGDGLLTWHDVFTEVLEKGAEGEGYGKKEWERACNISPEICCIMMVVGYEDIIFIQLLIHKMKYKLMRSVIREGGEGRGREEWGRG